jgi:hypothetical protein
MEHNLQKLARIKNIHLTDSERAHLRACMAYQMSINPVMPRISWIQKSAQHGIRIVLSTSIFLVFVCGSISVVANSALPGDPLYAFKLNVNEEVKGAFLKTPDAKIAWQKTRIETRLNEIQILAQSKSLTPAKQATVEKALDAHVVALTKELSQQDPTKALATTATVEATLQAKKAAVFNADASGTTSTDTNTTAAAKTIDNAIQKVSDQEVQLLTNQIEAIKTDTQNTTVESSQSQSTTPSKAFTPSVQ